MGERNRVVIRIASTEYTVCGEESPEYIQKVAALVDRKTREIMKASPSLSVSHTAVLASINMGDEVMRQHAVSDGHLRKMRDMEKRMEAAAEETEALRREVLAARENLARIKGELVRCETENRTLREQVKRSENGGEKK